MKKLNLLIGLLIGFMILSCSSDDSSPSEENNSEKKLTQIIYENLNNQTQFTRNIAYDASNNVREVTDNNNQLIEKFTYNSSNQIIENEFYEYQNMTLTNKDVTSIMYDNTGKISSIVETHVYYNADGSVSNQNSINHTITYGANAMTRISDDFANTRIEYSLTNNLITGIKKFRNNELKSDMTFAYDSGGNCISGNGPIDEGSLDTTTDDIELSVSYGSEEKNPIFNISFNYEILTRTSFYNIRQALINLQGNRYPEEIQWYQYSDFVYRETYDNSFDNDGYLISRTLSSFPDYPNSAMTTYTWE